MALNTKLYFPNPTKSRTLGLSGTIQSDAYSYSTLYTVLSTETLKIRDGVFQIQYNNTSGAVNEGYVILDISGKEIVVFSNNNIGASVRTSTIVTLSDLGISNVELAIGDTIKIKYIYPAAIGAYTGTIKATLFLDDYTA